jgi:hypothetical protein
MVRNLVPLLVVVVTLGLTAATAIEFLPETSLVVEFSTLRGLDVTFLQPGRTDESECERVLSEVQMPGGAMCGGHAL